MNIEAFNRAQQVFAALRTDEYFEHAAPSSRGIRIQADSLIEGMLRMAIPYSSHIQSPITQMAALIQFASADYGTYVRVAHTSTGISIDVRGLLAPTTQKPPTFLELHLDALRRSGVEIDVAADGKSTISAHSGDYMRFRGRKMADVINDQLKLLPQEQQNALAKHFVEAIAQEVAQSGEFLELRTPPQR